MMQETILIVDDQDDVRDYLSYALIALEKYEVLTAKSGAEGLRILESEKIDLVVTDQQMPKMTGLEMLTMLKARDLHIPSILATGQGSEETAVAAFHLGVLDYLIKPVNPDTLETSVEKALHTARLERERTELLQELLQNNASLQQRAREFNVLYGVGQTINAAHPLEIIFQRVVDGAVFAIDADEGGLVLWDAEQNICRLTTIKEKNQGAHVVSRPIESRFIDRALQTGQPVLIERNKDLSARSRTNLSNSSLHVPILSYGTPIGVLYVTSSNPDRSLRYTDTQILAALADYVALAMRHDESGRLLTKEEDGLQELQELEDAIGDLEFTA